MISSSISRRQFIGCTGVTTVGSVALLLLHEASGASGPGDARDLASLPDEAPEVTLHWDEGPEDAMGFVFEWGEDGVTFPNVVSIEGRLTRTSVAFPRPGTYYGRLKAYNAAGTSPPGQTLIIPVKS